jgi:hypothetical protein
MIRGMTQHELIGEGREAEVLDWEPGFGLKLMRHEEDSVRAP